MWTSCQMTYGCSVVRSAATRPTPGERSREPISSTTSAVATATTTWAMPTEIQERPGSGCVDPGRGTGRFRGRGVRCRNPGAPGSPSGWRRSASPSRPRCSSRDRPPRARPGSASSPRSCDAAAVPRLARRAPEPRDPRPAARRGDGAARARRGRAAATVWPAVALGAVRARDPLQHAPAAAAARARRLPALARDRALVPALAVLAATVLVVSPWVVRNRVQVGCFAITTDSRALWKANNLNTYDTLAAGKWIDDVPRLAGAPPWPEHVSRPTGPRAKRPTSTSARRCASTSTRCASSGCTIPARS